MEGRCDKHPFDPAEDRCARCGCEFCQSCLVYSFGPKKPPFCIPCAVAAAGVRSNAGFGPAISRKEQRQLRKEREAALRNGHATSVSAAAAVSPIQFEWCVPDE